MVIEGAALGDGPATRIAVRDGVIVETGSGAGGSGAHVLDADGLVALPAFVDIHTHLREPGREDAETVASGAAAAAVGGFSAILAMANTSPVTDTAEAAERIMDLGRAADLVDVQPIGAVTKGLEGTELAELGLMARSRAGVRVFSDDGKCVADSQVMRRALEYIKAFDGVISQHAQDPRLAGSAACCTEGEHSGRFGLPGWPTVAEDVIVSRDVHLASYTGSRVHVAHVTSPESLEIIRWAKKRGIKVTCEVTPHHLTLPADLLADFDPVFKVNPPLRTAADIEALRVGLEDGTIDAIATDHAPHAAHDKDHAFTAAAFGMLGLETSFAVINTIMVATGRMSWDDVARTMSTAPAKIAGLASGPRAHGVPLAVGSPANIVLVDPTTAWTPDRDRTKSLSRNNPWHGRPLTGAVHATMRRGRVTYHREESA